MTVQLFTSKDVGYDMHLPRIEVCVCGDGCVGGGGGGGGEPCSYLLQVLCQLADSVG